MIHSILYRQDGNQPHSSSGFQGILQTLSKVDHMSLYCGMNLILNIKKMIKKKNGKQYAKYNTDKFIFTQKKKSELKNKQTNKPNNFILPAVSGIFVRFYES